MAIIDPSIVTLKTMHFSTVTLPEIKLVGMTYGCCGPLLPSDAADAWAAFLARESEIRQPHGVRYRVCLSELDGVSVALLATEVADLNTLPPGMVGVRIPARPYALLSHRGPQAAVPATYMTGLATIEQLGMRYDTEALSLERYTRGPVASPAPGGHDILIPLVS